MGSGGKSKQHLQHGQQQEQQEQDETLATWQDTDTHLQVSQGDGFFITLSLVARIPLPPDQVYAILTSPDNARVFRSIKAIKGRKVLEDSHGRQTVQQEQVGRWRMGPFRGVFSTHLRVKQDSHARTVTYELAKPMFMKAFAGSWQVEPFDQEGLDILLNTRHHAAAHASPLHRLSVSLARAEAALLGHKPGSSLVRLQQSLLPAMLPPPPLDWVVAKVAAKQVLAIMADLRAEADRINRSRRHGDSGDRSKEPAKDKRQIAAHIKELPSQ